jgi:hypothetical protein
LTTFLSTFWQLFDNFLTTFWLLFDSFLTILKELPLDLWKLKGAGHNLEYLSDKTKTPSSGGNKRRSTAIRSGDLWQLWAAFWQRALQRFERFWASLWQLFDNFLTTY